MAKRMLKTCCLLLLGTVLLLNLLTMFLNGLGLDERLNWMPGALLSVESGSMEPILSEGDLLLIWETPYEKLKVGDIVTFHGNNELITHQIVRREGELFVPRGVANNIEDAPIGPAEYCAKVIWTIPGGGAALDLLTSPASLALLVVFILVAFFGMPVLNWIYTKIRQHKAEPMRFGAIRLMSAAAAISLCCVAPFVTAAKYTADINEYGFVSAGATYFTSNYLSEEVKSHSVKGWGGRGTGLTLELRNYENDLLINENMLSYDLHIEINGEEGFVTGYSIVVKEDGNGIGTATAGDPISIRRTLSGSDLEKGEGIKENQFQIEVIVPEESPLNPREKINFRIWAETVNDKDFAQKLEGVFTYEVAQAGNFLGDQTLTHNPGSSLVTYSIKTQLADGAATRNVKVSWPCNEVYLNTYETTAANIIASAQSEYVANDGNGSGYLIMPLHAYSNITLQFFKYDSNAVLNEDAFTCVLVETN